MPISGIEKEKVEFEKFVLKCISLTSGLSKEETRTKWDSLDKVTKDCVLIGSPTFDQAFSYGDKFFRALKADLKEVPPVANIASLDQVKLVYNVECRVMYALRKIKDSK